MSKILNGKTHGLQRQRFCPSIHECWVKSLGEDCNLRGSITIGVIEIYLAFKVTNITFYLVWAII